MYLNKLKLCFR